MATDGYLKRWFADSIWKCGPGIERWEIALDQPGEYQLRMFKDYYQQKKGSVVDFISAARCSRSVERIDAPHQSKIAAGAP